MGGLDVLVDPSHQPGRRLSFSAASPVLVAAWVVVWVAELVLVSPRFGNVTGSNVLVDGGLITTL